METKYTKGKWVKRQGDSDYKFDILGEFGTNKTIALIPNKCFVSDEEAEANAKLIASAPELLQALQDIVWLMTDDENGEIYDDYKLFPIEAINKAKEAIKKANH